MTDLERVSYGIWRPAAAVADLPGRAAALLSTCPNDTVVSGISAARLHGIWLPELPDRPLDVIVHREVSAPSDRGHNRRPEIDARRRRVLPEEVTRIDAIPVLTEARTWFELASVLPLPDLIAAGDSCLRGSATLPELQLIVARARRCPGVVAARTALPFLDARSRSRPESHLRYALVSGGLPKPNVNTPIFDSHGGWLGEPDLSYDDVRLALEYNGAEHATERRMRKDITRGFDFAAGGWRTEVFGPAQVFGRPDQVASLVRQLRAERRRRAPHRRSA